MLNKSGESRHTCLVPDLKGNVLGFSPLSMMAAVGLSYMAYVTLGYTASVSSLLRLFFLILCVARGILVPQPGIEPMPRAVGARSLNHWTTREVLLRLFIVSGC